MTINDEFMFLTLDSIEDGSILILSPKAILQDELKDHLRFMNNEIYLVICHLNDDGRFFSDYKTRMSLLMTPDEIL